MSLDGFIAGPGDAMDWVFRYDGPNPLVDENLVHVAPIFNSGVSG